MYIKCFVVLHWHEITAAKCVWRFIWSQYFKKLSTYCLFSYIIRLTEFTNGLKLVFQPKEEQTDSLSVTEHLVVCIGWFLQYAVCTLYTSDNGALAVSVHSFLSLHRLCITLPCNRLLVEYWDNSERRQVLVVRKEASCCEHIQVWTPGSQASNVLILPDRQRNLTLGSIC